HAAQLSADGLKLALLVLLAHLEEALALTFSDLREPLLGKGAILDLVQKSLHLLAHVLINDLRAGVVVTVLSRVTDRVAHVLQAALVHKVDDKLKLVEALKVRDLGLVAGLDQRIEPGFDQGAGAATEHGLLAEQVGFRLFLERGLDDASLGGTEALAVSQRGIERLASRILVDRDQGWHADALLEQFADPVTRALRGDHRDVNAFRWG